MSTPPAPSIDQIKASQRAAWMAGDFGVIAKIISGGAEPFAASLGLPPDARVLDVACGTGNSAIPLARRGCIVTGVDIAPNLLIQARERAAAESLSITFDEGDAEQLPYPDASFDAVISMFGAMFAPRPEIVVSEFARVLRPGGLLAMANWNPGSFTARMFQVAGSHAAQPSSVPSSTLWGDDAIVRRRLSPFFANIETTLVPIDFDLPVPPAGAVDFFRKYFGPTHVAFSRLDAAGQTAFAAALEEVWSAANGSPTPATHTLVRNEYLRVTATRS